jgi:S1-C subfamily serine protease
MPREDRRVLAFLASAHRLACSALTGLALLMALPAAAQELPLAPVNPADIRQALIWTGHLTAFGDNRSPAALREATRSWQNSRKYPLSETLPDEQADELVSDGLKQREAVGWSTLRDKGLGFSLGVPARLTRLVGPRTQNNATMYDFEGRIGYAVAVRYGDWNCNTLGQILPRELRQARPHHFARSGDRFTIAYRTPDGEVFESIVCRTSGTIVASIAIPNDQLPSLAPLFAAMADSLVVSRHFNATAVARPVLDEVPPAPGDFQAAERRSVSRTAPRVPDKDDGGKTDALTLEPRSGADMRAEEVFEKAAGAVYKVSADKRLGSAVAVSETELLTNCHVVGDKTRVWISRDKKEWAADVVSVNAKADRCVLKTESKLGKWVAVRPYDDIKVGERALTIGTPQGLELTVAEGIFSSKRPHKGARLIQTSAPISQGSSGGGLFDAQGRLLGITTFYFKVGQNLNFAVAAQDYAK